jgi:hypothetical protein
VTITLKAGEGRFPPEKMMDAIDASQSFMSHQLKCQTCRSIMKAGDDEGAKTRALCDEGLAIFTEIALAICIGTGMAIVEASKNAIELGEVVAH